jgi:histidyl-tRNA synthetase
MSNVESIQQQITEQGNKVRQLKTEKADKAIIDAEVALLVGLKKKLAELTGEDPSGKKKSKQFVLKTPKVVLKFILFTSINFILGY